MNMKSKEALRSEKVLEFFELEILHLLKSGSENPKITEHFTKRVREFLKLPEDMLMQPIVLGDSESIRNLAGIISRIKKDIGYIEERVNKLKHELGALNVSVATSAPPKPDSESGIKPKM